ncbi:MAG: YihA family ribosome biogenesis GTP-binding protein [Clostridia bacterium]|nr:YihA family ribosome biogenesis GTP-binding protein [Clostridia bacterium]
MEEKKLFIRKASFVTSLTGYQHFPAEGLPQIAVAGRSNVGKSSLINCLCNNGKLARTSAEPGKTRLINVFSVNDSVHLMDLPGYGYARVSKDMSQDWGRMMQGYFDRSEQLRHVLLLVDIRHEPSQDDVQMAAYIHARNLPCTVVATKADKLSRAQRSQAVLLICRTLAVQPWQVVPFSSISKMGKEELTNRILGIGEKEE